LIKDDAEPCAFSTVGEELVVPRLRELLEESYKMIDHYRGQASAEHIFEGPDCVLCGCFGPIEDDQPCVPRKKILDLLRKLFDSCCTTHPDWGYDICAPDGTVMSEVCSALYPRLKCGHDRKYLYDGPLAAEGGECTKCVEACMKEDFGG
jgi:hypothetical protein